MCAESTIKNHLALAMGILLIGGGCLGWVGNKAVDYTFSDVRQNTEARIQLANEIKHLDEKVDKLEDAIEAVAIMKELVIRIDERTSEWEPNAQ
mgnify:FL=1